ncbi:MAG TPA: hypothetical protein ENN12_01215 [Epsilonproteobacteria bacterium]|nr:hypothetical protein [Campylobacterota bacterium]
MSILKYLDLFSKLLAGAILVFLVVGCGYKPSAHYVKEVLNVDSVWVDINVDSAEPENAPFLKDELHRLVIVRLGGKLAKERQTKNVMRVSYDGTTFTPLAYDRFGYVTRYQTLVRTRFSFVDQEGKRWAKTISTLSDESISDNALHASALRIEAIKKGLEKSVDEFLSYLSVKGALKVEK